MQPSVANQGRVLVVDDSELIRRMVGDLLDGEGFDVEEADGGEAAVSRLDAGSYDVVLTELQMPAPDGFDLLALVKERALPTEVVILTGPGARDVDAAIRALHLGAHDYLTKPLADPREAVLAVRRALEAKLQRAALRAAETRLRELQRQLAIAQKQEAIGRLTGGIAHDFNNILNVIVGHTELLMRRVAPQEEDRVRKILEAAGRASGLARQLMRLGRRQAVEPRVLSLDALVAELSSMLAQVIGEDVRLDVRARSEWSVEADPGQLEQVVLNLAINARDAMPQGGTLTIETDDVAVGGDGREPPVPAGSYVVLRVADDGHGMDAETLGRIFEPYFTTKPDGRGSGLGLAMVHDIVRRSGGVVRVESEVGQGTTFSIYLPRAVGTAPVADAPVAETGPTDGHEGVLIVEDEELARDMLRETVETLGYRTWVAASGEEALEILRRIGGSIDVLVTDVVMPGLSGIGLAERARTAYPDLRVVCVSGYPPEVISNHGGVPDGVPLLSKPFTPEAFGRCLREVLDRPAARTTATASV